MTVSKKNPQLKPAVSSADIIKAITSPKVRLPQKERTFLPGEGFDYSPENEEADMLKLMLEGGEIKYKD